MKSKDLKESTAYLFVGLKIPFYHEKKLFCRKERSSIENFTHRGLSKFLNRRRVKG